MLKCASFVRHNSLSDATQQHPFVNSLGMKFVPVPGTNILMCIHETRNVDYAAYAAEQLILDKTWRGEMEAAIRWSGEPQGQYPVVAVSYRDAQAFCRWLSIKDGKTYQLPTNQEWSSAVGFTKEEGNTALARHGNGTVSYPWGCYYPPKPQDGNFHRSVVKDGHDGRAPVMSYKANSIGIYDLGGNVMEWCQDRLFPGRTDRVLRSAAFSTYPYDRDVLRSSYQFILPPGARKADVGFRCVIKMAAADKAS